MGGGRSTPPAVAASPSIHTSCIKVLVGSGYNGAYLSVVLMGRLLVLVWSVQQQLVLIHHSHDTSSRREGLLLLPSPVLFFPPFPFLPFFLFVRVLVVVSHMHLTLSLPHHPLFLSSPSSRDSYTESVTVLPVPNERAAAIQGILLVRAYLDSLICYRMSKGL